MSNAKWKMREKPYFCIHILHISIEIRKPYELCLALSMVLLAKAVQTLPIGTAYPVWTGIGALGTVLGVHCMESNPYSDYAKLTYPIKGEYLISKRRYSAFFGTDLEILLKGLKANTTITYG